MSARLLIPGVLAGLIFGAGLVVSDMVNPARVLAFLDIAGAWDPTLAFVIGGALIPSAVAYAAARRMDRPVLEPRFDIPQGGKVDSRLLAGSALFGAGWGLAGLCPGPALAGLASGRWEFALFTAAMLAGMVLAQRLPLFSRPKGYHR